MDIHEKRKIILDKLKHFPYSLKDFSYHDRVSFSWLDGEREGIIYAINEIDFYYGVSPSIDIWVENENTLYKDIPIVNVKKIINVHELRISDRIFETVKKAEEWSSENE